MAVAGMSVAGTWHLVIDTPIGRQRAAVVLARGEDGSWQGTARSMDGDGAEEIPLTEVVVEGDEVRWRQAITKPLRLNLAFTLTADGDRLTGKAKAGRLPA